MSRHRVGMWAIGCGLAAVMVAASAAWVPEAAAQAIRDEFWVVDGDVDAIAVAGGRLYIGGNFSRVGPATGGWVKVDNATGTVEPPVAMVAGEVISCASDGSGGWYIGGDFTHVNYVPRSNLAHFDKLGNLTDWNPGASGQVDAIAVLAGIVYVGGSFLQCGGAPRSFLAAIDGVTGQITPWNPGTDGFVKTLCWVGGLLYVGGQFNTVGGLPRPRLAHVEVSGVVGGWAPNPNGHVYGLTGRSTINGNVIYVSGDFTAIAGQPRNRVAAFTEQFSPPVLSSWNPNADGPVRELVVSGSTVYVGGDFTAIGGAARAGLAALNFSGVATAWNPSPNDSPITALAVRNGVVYVGGDFEQIGGQPRFALAAIDEVSGAATAWNPNPNLGVYTLATNDTAVFVGGNFSSMGGVTRHDLAALDLMTGQAVDWAPEPNDWVSSMTTSGNTLYVGGAFTSIGGATRRYAAAFDATTGALNGWNPNADSWVMELEAAAGAVYAGGWFDNIGNAARSHIAALDPASGNATAWNPGANSGVFGIKVWLHPFQPLAPIVFIGGSFTTAGGQVRSKIAAIDGFTGGATAWNPGADQDVTTIWLLSDASFNPIIYAGGCFQTLGGQPRPYLGCVGANGVTTSWAPNASGCVGALQTLFNTIWAGTSLPSASPPRYGLSAIDRTTGLATDWIANADHAADDIVHSNGTIYVGGNFWTIAGTPHSGIAAFTRQTVDVEEPPAPVANGRLFASPNPSSGAVGLQFMLAHAGVVDIAIYDVAGRRVRRLFQGSRAAGPQRFDWDGRDDAGANAGTGLYFARVTSADFDLTTKLLRTR